MTYYRLCTIRATNTATGAVYAGTYYPEPQAIRLIDELRAKDARNGVDYWRYELVEYSEYKREQERGQ